MASRNGILRLALVAGLAVLLSGCYAHHGARYQYGHYGAYSHYNHYSHYGGSHHAAPGHAYHKRKHHKDGHHRHRRHHRARAQDWERSPEGAPRTERRRRGHRDSDAQALQRDGHRAANREDGRRAANREDGRRAATRKDDSQRRAEADHGRGATWSPGPTARDEGPRPGAEGGAR